MNGHFKILAATLCLVLGIGIYFLMETKDDKSQSQSSPNLKVSHKSIPKVPSSFGKKLTSHSISKQSTLSQQEAQKLFEKKFKEVLLSDLRLENKLERYQVIIRDLAGQCETEHVIEFIDELYDPSAILKSQLLEAIFRESKQSTESLFALAEQINDERDKSFALKGIYLKKSELKNPVQEMSKAFEAASSKDSQQGLAAPIYKLFSDPYKSDASCQKDYEALMKEAGNLSGEQQAAYLMAAMQGISTRMPFQSWEILQKQSSENFKSLGGKNLDEMKAEIFATMFQKDEKKAMDLVLSSESKDINLLGKILSEWSSSNSRARHWYSENKNRLTLEQTDQFHLVFAENAFKRNDLDFAKESIRQISDPMLRAKVEGKLEMKNLANDELQMMTELKSNPLQKMNDLIKPQSKREESLIGRAMLYWISTNPAEAEEWHQQNWNTLPPQKRQYVADAYARDAIFKGDFEAARQWLSHVTDPVAKADSEAFLLYEESK